MAQPLTANMDNIHAEEGRCGEEDLVKSFFPSLFDSDSDSEDVYCLHPLPSLETHRGGSVSVCFAPLPSYFPDLYMVFQAVNLLNADT